MKKVFFITLLFFAVLPFGKVFSVTPYISFVPESPLQGEPVMIVVENAKLSQIQKATLEGRALKLFSYNNKPTAFYGVDIIRKLPKYEVEVTFKDGTSIKRLMKVTQRKKIEEVFSIPKKLGGDTTASQKILVASLAQENANLNKITTNPKIYWTSKFTAPLKEMVVTDKFGYSRNTGGYVLTHKGTDLRASEGTEVFAMNDGLVKVVSEGRNYGKHIVIDHGLGVMTFYLHLSKTNVKQGDMVTRGQLIGLSGQTGYAAAPHLHLSIRIYNIAIDPMTFLELFK